ncbi:MAG: hypothetical protein M1406_04205 [Nitrospirae bacterium]|nr:hypothetical protein [Nitrospirota bacterium]
MKILHILKTEPEDSVKAVIEEHRKCHDVTVIEIYKSKEYDLIVELVERADKVISW